MAAFIQDRPGPEPRRPLRPAAEPGRHPEALHEGRGHPGERGQASLPCSRRGSPSSRRSRPSPSFPYGATLSIGGARDPADRRRHLDRRPLRLRDHVALRLRDRARRLVLEQQVLADGRHPRERPAHLLRARHDDGGRGRDPGGRELPALRHRRDAAGHVARLHPPLEPRSAVPRLPRLLHRDLRRDQPPPLRPAGGGGGARGRATTPSTRRCTSGRSSSRST